MSPRVYWARGLLFIMVLGLSLAIFVPFLLLTFPAKSGFRIKFSNLWFRFIAWALRVIGRIRPRFQGLERIPGPAVIYLVKHQSTLETFLMQPHFPPYVWVVKKQLLKIPIFGWGLAMIKPIFIDRSAGTRAVTQIIDQGRERLAEGFGVVVFPEGTRTPPGTQRRYKMGGALLAEAAGHYPVVPVAHNAGYFWPPRQYFLGRPGIVDFSVGPPIDPQGLSAEEITSRAQEWIEAESARLAEAPAFDPFN